MGAAFGISGRAINARARLPIQLCEVQTVPVPSPILPHQFAGLVSQQLADLDPEVISRTGAPTGSQDLLGSVPHPRDEKALQLPFTVDRSCARPYTETLVFLDEHGGESSIHQLVNAPLAHFGDSALRPRDAAGNHPGNHQGLPPEC